MLKIKDDVNLEKLEEYGLCSVGGNWYEYCNRTTQKEFVAVAYIYSEKTTIFINKDDRIIYCCGTDLDILYKLIADGLVEIVENYNNVTRV